MTSHSSIDGGGLSELFGSYAEVTASSPTFASLINNLNVVKYLELCSNSGMS
jgi:hypothetical protein